jgi:hypothetical protein
MKSYRTILFLTLQLALCSPALAQDYIDEEAFEELTDQGIAAYEQAQAAVRRDDWPTACTQFTRAANLWSEARADAPAEAASANLNDTTMARRAANDACTVANGTTPFDVTDARSDGALNAQKSELQKSANWGMGQYQVAMRRYNEGDRAGACSAARLAADELAKVTAAMRANPALEAAFGNPAQLYQNAKDMAEVRDDTFCKG